MASLAYKSGLVLRGAGKTNVISVFANNLTTTVSDIIPPKTKEYDLVVVGGGTGGSLIANKFAPSLGKGKVAVVEPSEFHYYQPMWTLVGGGIKTLNQSESLTEWVLPKQCDWIKDRAVSFDPDNNKITIANGDTLQYKYLVVGMGMQLDYDKVPGLVSALEQDPAVCSNYSKLYVNKTFKAAEAFQKGNAIFTFPNTPIKCAGAPQKIAYLLEEYFCSSGKRDNANVLYNTSLPAVFGIPRYAHSLNKVCKSRNITINTRQNLIEVNSNKREATFELLDKPGETVTYPYELLHATPPMSSPDVLKNSPLVDAAGFVDVNKDTLQHKKYQNVFGIGDCSNSPNAKTAAAVAGQGGVVGANLKAVMNNSPPYKSYDGYASCPLITGKYKCILAEFGYDGAILETFPIDQSVERRTMYHMKADFLPQMYWHMLVKGIWDGPGIFRKLMNPKSIMEKKQLKPVS